MEVHIKARIPFALGVLGIAAPCALAAQTVLHTYIEPESGAQAGTSVAIWDDVNGDGFRDWVVGAPAKNGVGPNSGHVLIFSGLNNSLLTSFVGAQANSALGKSVANVGDLNGDGFDELAVGAPGDRTVYVYSGASLALLWSRSEPAISGYGGTVSAGGDVNGDGVLDVATCAYGHVVAALSGLGGALIFTHAISGQDGGSLASVGDLNGDGFDDLLMGPRVLFGGSAQAAVILAGPNGTVLRTIPPPVFALSSQFGWSVCGVGDQDGDGVGEYAIGDPSDAAFVPGVSFVTVYSGATGATLATLSANNLSEFGAALANAGDVDADGFDDIVIGATGDSRTHIYSIVRNTELYSYFTTVPNYLGASVAGNADVNNDGWPDAVGGAGSLTFNQTPTTGGAVLMTLGCPSDAVYNYCTAVSNSTGQRAKMNWTGSTSVSSNSFRLAGEKCPLNKFGLFFYGTTPTELPAGEGHLCVTGPTFRFQVVSTGATGTPSHLVDFTSPPSPAGQISAGETWYFSLWFRDPSGGPSGFNFADGLRATFCP